jgi:hypothetical protein
MRPGLKLILRDVPTSDVWLYVQMGLLSPHVMDLQPPYVLIFTLNDELLGRPDGELFTLSLESEKTES